MRNKILRRRYLWKDEQGNVVETEDQMFRRVGMHVASAETKCGSTGAQVKEQADRYYCLMRSLKFLPDSPTLMNAGRDDGMLSACFVLPIEDSIEGIFDAVRERPRCLCVIVI